MTTKEERLNKTRGRLETWYGCPIDEGEFRVIYAHHQKSKYLLFILWVLELFLIAASLDYLPFYFIDHPLGFFLVANMVILGYYIPISFVRRFSPTIVKIRGIIHSFVNVGFLVLGVGFVVIFIGAGSLPQAIVEAIGMCAVGAITTFLDIRFYRNFYGFNKRVRSQSVQVGAPANLAKVE